MLAQKWPEELFPTSMVLYFILNIGAQDFRVFLSEVLSEKNNKEVFFFLEYRQFKIEEK